MGKTVVVAALGVGLGTFSVVGDRIPFLAAPANAIGPWIVTAALAGAVAGRPRPGILAGPATLVLAVTVYYLGVRLVWGEAFVDPLRAAAVWALVAVVVGAPVGAAGGAVRGGPEAWRVPGVALVAGLLLAEALTRFVEVEGWTGIDLSRTALQVWAYDTFVALGAPLLLLDRRQWVGAYATSAAMAVAAAGLLALSMSLIRTMAAGS